MQSLKHTHTQTHTQKCLCPGYLKNLTFTIHHPRQGCHCPTSLYCHHYLLHYLQLCSQPLSSFSLSFWPTYCQWSDPDASSLSLAVCLTHSDNGPFSSVLLMLDLILLTPRGQLLFKRAQQHCPLAASLVFTRDILAGARSLINDGIQQPFGTSQSSSCFHEQVKQITSLNATTSCCGQEGCCGAQGVGQSEELLGLGPVLHRPWQSSAQS